MSRGILDEKELLQIAQQIPDLEEIKGIVSGFSPDFAALPGPHESLVPVAGIALKDAADTLNAACYALHEVHAHRIWYMEKKAQPNEQAATFFQRYYIDDAALRLYAAAEQLADAIKLMLEITDEEIKAYKTEGTSRQVAIGKYLKARRKRHPIAQAVARLEKSPDWERTWKYRNKWVHQQPPTVEGLGIVHRRRRSRDDRDESRWKPTLDGSGYTLFIGGGDLPEYSIQDLIGFIQPATFQFKDVLTSVVRTYLGMLKAEHRDATWS